ncbi:MAG: FeoB-associated Cys-rich membrane protein [Treponemataceae bacterium]|nr:FeoB-associated Cys-rich membrane protein [Treponemataceae bacterium]
MIGTIIVSVILVALVVGVIWSMIKTKRSGKHVLSCGGNCSSCGFCGSCQHHTPSESPEKDSQKA